MVKVALLGANGFIGSRVVEMFHLNALAEIRPVVRTFAGLARLSRFDLDFRVASAFDQAALQEAFAGCDVVIHAIAGDPSTILGTLAPTYLAAQAAGVRRFIYLSSASVHGQAPALGTDEESPLNDHQPIAYNNAKVQAEWKLQQLRTRGEVEVVILRPGIVYGPRSSWVVGFADALLQDSAYLINRGRGLCNSLYVDNLVEAILLAMKAPGVDGHAFLLGDKERITWADFYRPIAQALGYDLYALPEAEIPDFAPGWQARVRRLHSSKPVQAMLSLFPRTMRQAAYDALIASMNKPASPWSLPAPQRAIATEEMAMLYQCQVRLPFDKAKEMLGYEPSIAFGEASRRTLSWLAFAGYPLMQVASESENKGELWTRNP